MPSKPASPRRSADAKTLALDAAMAPGLSAADYERLSDFRFALRQFMAFSQHAARQVGLTPQQHQSLLAIKGAQARGGMSVGDLSRRMLLRHHSAVEQVDRLVEAGLVVRQEAKDDARKVMLDLTEAAEALLQRLSADHMEELRRVGPDLSALIMQFSGRDGGKTMK